MCTADIQRESRRKLNEVYRQILDTNHLTECENHLSNSEGNVEEKILRVTTDQVPDRSSLEANFGQPHFSF